MKPTEPLTASRMAKLLACPRAHYWRYEIGLERTDDDAAALRFGTAWHRAMEARWLGGTFESAFAAAIGEFQELDELAVATLSGLLRGYYDYWQDDPVRELFPELEFAHPLEGSRTFHAAGVIDGLGLLRDGRQCKVEHKTTSDSVEPESDYWLRLRFNSQVLGYVLEARTDGWDVACALYDVARKPSIRPLSSVNVLDDAGRKIVLDSAGVRVTKKDGSPRETGDTEKGYTVQTRPETLEEYSALLYADTHERPQFYFARREVPILEADLAEFAAQRRALAISILNYRSTQKRVANPAQAWPRNVDAQRCRSCEFSGFCLSGVTVDPANPPAGFRVGPKNAELSV